MPRKKSWLYLAAAFFAVWLCLRVFGTSLLQYEVRQTLKHARYEHVDIVGSTLVRGCDLTTLYGEHFVGVKPSRDRLGLGEVVSGYVCCSVSRCEILP